MFKSEALKSTLIKEMKRVLIFVSGFQIKTVRCLQGLFLSFGAPLTWMLIQWFMGRDPYSPEYFDAVLYWYLFCGSAVVWSGFGYYVGSSEEQFSTLAHKDSLTGLHNNRFFHQKLNEEFVRHRRSSLPLSLIHIDLDLFKRINDQYGHLMGDNVLKAVAKAMSSVCRDGELIFRVGGEEFCAILCECNREQAIIAANRFQQAIRAVRVKGPSVELRITASLGVVSTENTVPTEWDLFKAADNAMYKAKGLGRDRIAVSES